MERIDAIQTNDAFIGLSKRTDLLSKAIAFNYCTKQEQNRNGPIFFFLLNQMNRTENHGESDVLTGLGAHDLNPSLL